MLRGYKRSLRDKKALLRSSYMHYHCLNPLKIMSLLVVKELAIRCGLGLWTFVFSTSLRYHLLLITSCICIHYCCPNTLENIYLFFIVVVMLRNILRLEKKLGRSFSILTQEVGKITQLRRINLYVF